MSVPPRIGAFATAVDVIPRGRDPHKYQFRPAALRAKTRGELGLSPQSPAILAIGRLDPQKGFDHLIRALPEVAANNPGAVTIIAGKDGRSAVALRKAAQAAEAEIRFLGHRPDVPALLAAADVFCFPSEREGFGGVLIEALAVGCPVVASSIPTSREVLGGDASPAALFAPVGSHHQLAQALIETLENPTLSAVRARDGRTRFEQLFTIDNVVSQMIEFFATASTTR